MKPNVYNDAFLYSKFSFAALAHRLGIKVFHSFLGISMLAIIDIAVAI